MFVPLACSDRSEAHQGAVAPGQGCETVSLSPLRPPLDPMRRDSRRLAVGGCSETHVKKNNNISLNVSEARVTDTSNVSGFSFTPGFRCRAT